MPVPFERPLTAMATESGFTGSLLTTHAVACYLLVREQKVEEEDPRENFALEIVSRLVDPCSILRIRDNELPRECFRN